MTGRSLVPSADSALKALLSGNARVATARFAARVLADPTDRNSRGNHAIALYEAGRWADAAAAFERILADEGYRTERVVPMLFSLGYCRLELGDYTGSLLATAAFLDLSNIRHPFYWDGVNNIACAWSHLEASEEAVALYRTVIRANPNPFAYNGFAAALADLGRVREALWVMLCARRAGIWNDLLEGNEAIWLEEEQLRKPMRVTARPWARKRIIETSFRMLGFDAVARPARKSDWGLEC